MNFSPVGWSGQGISLISLVNNPDMCKYMYNMSIYIYIHYWTCPPSISIYLHLSLSISIYLHHSIYLPIFFFLIMVQRGTSCGTSCTCDSQVANCLVPLLHTRPQYVAIFGRTGGSKSPYFFPHVFYGG